MKKLTLNLMLVVFLSLASITAMASDKSPMVSSEKPTTEVPADVKILLDRVDEIKNMDKSNLKSSERKELRRELREIKRELRGKGIYISTGALIIIILLILLL